MAKIKGVYIILILLITTSCSIGSDKQNKIAAVTILPQKYLLDKIVGDSIDVVCAIPEGGNPEEYSATTRQMEEIATSSLYFKVGELGFEKTTLSSILSNTPNIKVVTLSEDIDFIASTCSHGEEEHLHYDPHYWSSPKCTKIMATNMYKAIIEYDKANKSYYKNNYEKLIVELDALDIKVDSLLSATSNRKFAIFHPSLSYFARDYGLEQISLERNGKEITPNVMLQTIEEAINSGVKTVFIQNEFNTSQIETFADEIGAEVVVINPLAYNIIEEILKVAYAIAK